MGWGVAENGIIRIVMTWGELEIAVRAPEVQRLELKKSFGAECVATVCDRAGPDNGGHWEVI